MLLDRLSSIYAPFDCMVCGAEGELVCMACSSKIGVAKRSTCYLCNSLTSNWQTCGRCVRKSKLKGAIIASHYEGYVKELVRRLKYQRTAAAADILGRLMAPLIDPRQHDLITWVPAATRRQRQRGYNQAYLIAKSLAHQTSLPLKHTLNKTGQLRQVGTSRRRRLTQVGGTMHVNRRRNLKGQRLLIVDDVITTGATLTEAAKVLKAAGAKTVWAAAVAKH